MPILIADDSTVATLSSVSEPDEVRTADGRLLGQFIPAGTPKISFPEIGATDEELEAWRTDSSAVWHTPEQVMARLRDLRECSH
jgi:hypothetical protein